MADFAKDVKSHNSHLKRLSFSCTDLEKQVLIMDFKIILLNKDKTKEMKSLNKNRASIPRGWQVNSA